MPRPPKHKSGRGQGLSVYLSPVAQSRARLYAIDNNLSLSEAIERLIELACSPRKDQPNDKRA